MKAVVWHGIGDIRLDEVPEPTLRAPTDAVIRITTSAICGTDLHFVRGTMAGMRPGTILGHEAVGIVEQAGPMVRNFAPGDRVVVCSTISCGTCAFCRAGVTAQCDNANPGGPLAGTAFFGGPEAAGGIDGLQAERARIPFAANTLVALPDAVTDDQAILLSDIFPTAWYGAILAGVREGSTVAVFGCGPVGQFAIVSARLQGAGRIIAIDSHDDRLAMAQRHGAHPVNFDREDPIETIRALTGGIGVDCAIDAVGVDSQHAHHGPAAKAAVGKAQAFRAELEQVAPKRHPDGGNWVAGDAPTQAIRWAVDALAKAGTLGVIGVYPPQAETFPLGGVMNKNLTIRLGNCNHRTYVPTLIDMVRAGRVDPVSVLTQREPLTDAIEAYRQFDRREAGWIKTELKPAA